MEKQCHIRPHKDWADFFGPGPLGLGIPSLMRKCRNAAREAVGTFALLGF